jgi:hypothetical protein
MIEVELERKGEGVAGIVALPSGVSGVLRQPASDDLPGASIPLRPGRNFIV